MPNVAIGNCSKIINIFPLKNVAINSIFGTLTSDRDEKIEEKNYKEE